jgi:hypothetical protein
MFPYTAYGLGIHSFLPLPELIAAEQKADVLFRLGKVNGVNLEMLDEERSFKATSDEAYYYLESVGKFLVREGREVIIDPNPGADKRAIRLCLLGPLLALILHQRQLLVLHASAVANGDKAIVFLGGHGWGKSTLAAALHLQGQKMLADDVTAIQMDSNCPKVLPGFPQFKLWPNAVTALGENPEALPVLQPDFAKRAFRVTACLPRGPLPLKHIYVLATGEHLEIESLRPQEALLELIRHSYASHFGNHLFHATGIVTHFKQCARLVQNVRLHRFRRPASLSTIDEHASMLIREISRDES